MRANARRPPVIENHLPEARVVDGVPMYALDKHTRLGRQAIARFARENEAVRACLEEHVPEYRHRDAACMAAFYADAVPLRRQLVWDQSNAVERLGTESDMLRAGVALPGIQSVLETFRANRDDLNGVRARFWRGRQADR